MTTAPATRAPYPAYRRRLTLEANANTSSLSAPEPMPQAGRSFEQRVLAGLRRGASCYSRAMVAAYPLPLPLPSDAELIARLNALPEGRKGEIIEGELFVQPRPRFRHARANSFLSRYIGGPFDMDEDGPGGWWILPEPGIELPRSPEVSPDVAGWRRERMPEPPPEGDAITLVPDWICEVLSPSNRRWDLKKKFPYYASIGVPWLWVVDPPARTISVRRLVSSAWTIVTETEGDESLALEPFATVELPLGRLWLP